MELLIVADGADVRDLVPSDSRIRLIHIEPGFSIGEKRNFAAGRAAGEILVTWDDDDYSAPGRIADQVERILATGKAVTAYSSMTFSDGRAWWRYQGRGDYAIGSSQAYRRDWWQTHPFPAKQVGEDSDFAGQARMRAQLSAVPAGELMLASIHRGNTSPRQLSGSNWIGLDGPPSRELAAIAAEFPREA